MTKTFCDRCEKEITQYIDNASLNYKLNKGLFKKGFPMDDTYVLCEDCWSEFLEWMKEKDS